MEVIVRDLQVQERLTEQIADRLQGVGEVIEAEHLCTSLRGMCATVARSVTATLDGL
ncbi:GTP cyclohydrolase I [Pseudonocardia sp. Cha107L01]|uniref:GTP cyclohydrolase I n=1 Tax=Pseudonocardia sp. Cha107L01 TaxID=3457576 RepID=UPI00403EE2A1